MTAFLIRIGLIILAVLAVRWFLQALRGNRNAGTPPKKKSSTGGDMVKDPVCGMYMDPRLAVKHEVKNGTFYFCSEECKKKFLSISSGDTHGTPPSES